MELKSKTEEMLQVVNASSNRTFMELKSGILGYAQLAIHVLIVPLWN